MSLSLRACCPIMGPPARGGGVATAASAPAGPGAGRGRREFRFKLSLRLRGPAGFAIFAVSELEGRTRSCLNIGQARRRFRGVTLPNLKT